MKSIQTRVPAVITVAMQLTSILVSIVLVLSSVHRGNAAHKTGKGTGVGGPSENP